MAQLEMPVDFTKGLGGWKRGSVASATMLFDEEVLVLDMRERRKA